MVNYCKSCEKLLHSEWSACPHCGVQLDNMFNSSLSMVDLASLMMDDDDFDSCRLRKSKPLKSKCCNKHQKKGKKYCKRCPHQANLGRHPLHISDTSGVRIHADVSLGEDLLSAIRSFRQ